MIDERLWRPRLLRAIRAGEQIGGDFRWRTAQIAVLRLIHLMRLPLALALGIVISVHNGSYKRGQIPFRGITRNAVAGGPRRMQRVMLESAWPAGQPVPASHATLPVSFEPNQGQVEGRVKYFARGAGSVLFLTAQDSTLVLSSCAFGGSNSKAETISIGEGRLSSVRNTSFPSGEVPRQQVLQMSLVGSDPTPPIEAVDELPGKSNYLIGNDPKNWRVGVPNYAGV